MPKFKCLQVQKAPQGDKNKKKKKKLKLPKQIFRYYKSLTFCYLIEKALKSSI